MTWIKLDDGFPEHRKALQAGDDGCWMFVAGLCYCGRNLTDGFIPDAQVARLTGLRNPMKSAQRLVDAGLWDATDGGFHIHDYAEYQPTKEQVRNRRDATADRVRKHRSNSVTDQEVTPLPRGGAGARPAGGVSFSASVVDCSVVEDACAQLDDSKVRETVEILKSCPRLTFDIELAGVTNALLAYPAVDHRQAAHTTVSNASDPNYRTTDAGRALRYALADLDKRGVRDFRASKREHPGDIADQELTQLAEDLRNRGAAA